MINFKLLWCTFSAFSPTIWLCTTADVSRVMQWNSPTSKLHSDRTFRHLLRDAQQTIRCRLRWQMFHYTLEVLLLFPSRTPPLRYMGLSTSADGHRRRRRTSTHRCREVHTSLLKYDVHITHYICRATHAILNPSNYNFLFKTLLVLWATSAV